MFHTQDHPGISPDELLALVKRDDPGAHFADHTVDGCRVLVTTTMRPDRILAMAPNLAIHTELDFFDALKNGPEVSVDAIADAALSRSKLLAEWGGDEIQTVVMSGLEL